MKQPRLRDQKKLTDEIYPINHVPREIVESIGAGIVYILHTGRRDLEGNDWGDIFAKAVGGQHLASPIGIADVVKGTMAWSMKTVKSASPFDAARTRLISGRCSPDYSFGIEDPHKDIQKTGEAVLAIWNSRVDIAISHYARVRTSILVRGNDMREFTLFEEYLEHFNLSDYEWRENRNSNLEAFNIANGQKQFVWQPHGSQFTILQNVPSTAVRFRIKKPEILTQEKALDNIGFDNSWVEII